MRSGTLAIRFMNVEVTDDFFATSSSEIGKLKIKTEVN